jgi:FtsZ-interacting cell division protein ZipA
MNKTLIIFGLVIIVIGILVAVLNITKKEESFDNIENFDLLRSITETFWEDEEKDDKKQKKKVKKTESAATEAQIQTESILSLGLSVEAAVESETARKLSKKTCMKSIIDYATSLVDQAKIAQDRSTRALEFVGQIEKQL